LQVPVEDKDWITRKNQQTHRPWINERPIKSMLYDHKLEWFNW
jgi:hypothetical protein